MADKVAANDERILNAPFGIDRRAIEEAGRLLRRREIAAIRYGAGVEIVVLGPHRLLKGIREVEGLVVWTPTRAVGADDPIIELGDLEIGI